MEKKRIVPVWLSVVMLLFAAFSIIQYFTVVNKALDWQGVCTCILYAVSCGLAILYYLAGYKKEGARDFKIFCAVKAAYHLLFLVPLTDKADVAGILCEAVAFGIMSVFLFGTDFGKKKSAVLALVGVGVALIPVILSAVATGFSDGLKLFLCNLLLAVIFAIMVLGKYVDKANRGTV